MIVCSFTDYEYLLDTLKPAVQKGDFEVRRFANNELFISLRTPVRMDHCLILGSIAPPDERLLSLALLAHTLKKEGARKVTAFLPYLAYDRQDKEKPGESLAIAWVGSLLQAAGVDEVCTIDVHSERDKQLFPIPLLSTFPARIFANAIGEHHLIDATIVAPDNGAIPRCRSVNAALGRPTSDVPYLEKRRGEMGIRHTKMHGNAGPRAVIIDDILDTGATLISACDNLLQSGTSEIFIMVTHGLFTGSDWRKLWSLKVNRIFCMDTIPPAKDVLEESRITIVSVGQLLKEQIAQLNADAAIH